MINSRTIFLIKFEYRDHSCVIYFLQGASDKQLEQLGKTLKKNNVSLGTFTMAFNLNIISLCFCLDIVSFGEVDENSSKLHKLHQAVNSNNTSHLVECPIEVGRLLSETVSVCNYTNSNAQTVN